MTLLTDEEAAQVILILDQRDLLATGTKEEIQAEFRKARTLKVIRQEQGQDDPDNDPDSQQSAEAATAWGEVLDKATEALRSNRIPTKRLEQIAEWVETWTETGVLMHLDPMP